MSTRAGRPWSLLCSSPCGSKRDAVNFESYIHRCLGIGAFGTKFDGHGAGYVELLRVIESVRVKTGVSENGTSQSRPCTLTRPVSK